MGETIRLIQAMVDVISSCGWLKPALAAMELAQVCVQGLWESDSPLLQLPHFTREVVQRCQAEKPAVETVFDVMELEDDRRNELLRMNARQLSDVAQFCNQYPNIDLAYEVAGGKMEVEAGAAVPVVVQLERETGEEEEEGEEGEGAAEEGERRGRREGEEGAAAAPGVGQVIAPRYSKAKVENWWLVVGDTATNSLLSIKRLVLKDRSHVRLDFNAPEQPGRHKFVLYFMCDSYMGCDQEYEFELEVQPAEGEAEEEEEEAGEGEGMDVSGDEQGE